MSLAVGGAVSGQEVFIELVDCPAHSWSLPQTSPGSEEQIAHLFFFLPQQKKKSKKERELEKQKAEKELSRIEEALMDPGRQPESADDFDRLVLSSPNSSILWLQYMAFHLQATEIEKARAVAERALKTISFRSRLCTHRREGPFDREGRVSPGCRACCLWVISSSAG